MYFSLTVQYNSLPKISFCQPLKSRFIDSYGLCIDFYYCDPPPPPKKKKKKKKSILEARKRNKNYFFSTTCPSVK